MITIENNQFTFEDHQEVMDDNHDKNLRFQMIEELKITVEGKREK